MVSLSALRSHCLTWASAALIGGLAATGSFTFFHGQPSAAQENLELRILSPTLRPGEPLEIEVSGDRKMLCIVSLSRRVKDVETGFTVYKEFVPGGFYGMGPWREKVRVNLPVLPDGLYSYHLLQANDCGQEVFPLSFPVRTFRIVSHH